MASSVSTPIPARPLKRLVRFDNAAHSVAFEQFEKFGVLMRGTVVPETYARP